MRTDIIFLILSIVCSSALYGQSLIIINDDTTKTYSDSLLLKTVNTYENASWEYLSEGAWISLDHQNTDSTFLLIDSSMYLRNTSFDPECQLRITDTVIIEAMQPIIVEGSEFTCDQEGGYFQLYDSTYISIYDSALAMASDLRFEIHDSYDGHDFGYVTDNPDRRFLFGFEFQGANPISKASKLKIKTSIIPANEILQIFKYNKIIQKWHFIDTYLLFSANEAYMQTHIGYGTYAVFTMPLLSGQASNSRVSQEDPCKSGTTHVETEAVDNSIDDCQRIVDETKVVFIDCGNTTGGIKEEHIDAACIPEVRLEIEYEVIKTGQQTKITFETLIANHPLEDQLVTLRIPESVKITETHPERTGSNGKMVFTLEGVSEALPATIEYTVYYRYYLSSQVAYDAEHGKEINNSQLIQKAFSDEFILYVIDACTEPDEIECSNLTKPASCVQIKEDFRNAVPVFMDVFPNPVELSKGYSVTELVTALNRHLQSVAPPEFTLHSDDPRTAAGFKTSDEAFAVIGIDVGQTTLRLRWCDNEEPVVVNVLKDTSCENSVVNVYPGSLTLVEGARYPLKIDYGEEPEFIPVLTFTSFHPQYASVNDNGIITAHQAGNTTITVSWCEGAFSTDIPVEVIDECHATNVYISPQYVVIEKREHYPLDIEYQTMGDDKIFVPLITWKSNDEAIAMVTDLGVIYGVEVGETTIEAIWCEDTTHIQVIVEKTLNYSISWTATIQGQLEESGVNNHVSWTRTTTVEGMWEGSADFVNKDTYGNYEVANLTTTGYKFSNNLTVSISDCGDHYRQMRVYQESNTSILSDRIEVFYWLDPELKIENDQCYFMDPFRNPRIWVHYSTLTQIDGWGCSYEEYIDYEHSTQVEETQNFISIFQRPGAIYADDEDCTQFSASVDIPMGWYNIHWEVSIVAIPDQEIY